MNDELKLLVDWSSPWQEFLSAIRPALGRSPEPLDGEAPIGLFPYRGMLASWIVEGALFALAIMLTQTIGRLGPSETPPMPKYDVIYFSGEELPRTEDAGGAQVGRSGRAGPVAQPPRSARSPTANACRTATVSRRPGSCPR